MSKRANRRNPPANQPQIPIYSIDAAEVDKSYRAYAATRIMAQSDPALTDNEYFCAIQDTAYARFLMNFEAMA